MILLKKILLDHVAIYEAKAHLDKFLCCFLLILSIGISFFLKAEFNFMGLDEFCAVALISYHMLKIFVYILYFQVRNSEN